MKPEERGKIKISKNSKNSCVFRNPLFSRSIKGPVDSSSSHHKFLASLRTSKSKHHFIQHEQNRVPDRRHGPLRCRLVPADLRERTPGLSLHRILIREHGGTRTRCHRIRCRSPGQRMDFSLRCRSPRLWTGILEEVSVVPVFLMETMVDLVT